MAALVGQHLFFSDHKGKAMQILASQHDGTSPSGRVVLTNPPQFRGRRSVSSITGGLVLAAMLGCCFAIGCGGSGDGGGSGGDADGGNVGSASDDAAPASPESGGSDDGAAAALHYSPDDSFVVMNIDVATIIQSQVGKDLKAAIARLPGAEDFEEEIDEEIMEEFGVSLSDLESVTMSARPLRHGPEFVVVLRLKDAVDVNSVLDEVYLPDWYGDEPEYGDEEAAEDDNYPMSEDVDFSDQGGEEAAAEDAEGFADESDEEDGAEEDEDGGFMVEDDETPREKERLWVRSEGVKTGTYYTGRAWRDDEAMWFPDDRTLVHGPAKLVKRIERRNGPARVSRRLARRIEAVDFGKAFTIVLEMPREAWDELEEEAEREVPWLSLWAIESVQVGSLEVTAGDEVKATATIEFDSAEIAADAGKAAVGAVAVFKNLFDLSNDARKTLDTMKVTASEGVVKAELTVPGETLVDLFSTVTEVIEENSVPFEVPEPSRPPSQSSPPSATDVSPKFVTGSPMLNQVRPGGDMREYLELGGEPEIRALTSWLQDGAKEESFAKSDFVQAGDPSAKSVIARRCVECHHRDGGDMEDVPFAATAESDPELALVAKVAAPKGLAGIDDPRVEGFPRFGALSKEPVLLRYKFRPGQKVGLRLAMEIDTRVRGEGQSLDMRMDMTIDGSYVVENIDDDRAQAAMVLDRMKMKMSGPVDLQFDSETDSESDNPAFRGLAAMTGVPMNVRVTSRGELLEGDTHALESAVRRAGGHAMMQQLGDTFDEITRSSFIQLADESISMGQSYDAGEIRKSMQNMGEMVANVRYGVVAVSDDRKQVLLRPLVKMRIESSDDDVRVNYQNMDGWILFDREIGNIRQSAIDMNADMDLSQQGQDFNVNMSMQMRYKTWEGSPGAGEEDEISEGMEEDLDVDSMEVGDLLFHEFDWDKAAGIEVAKYNEQMGHVSEFRVARDRESGAWVIPSHAGYPADAEDRMLDAKLMLVELQILGVASKARSDHKLFGVVSPYSEGAKVSDEGIGLLLTFVDGTGRELASLIIGKKVRGADNRRFVRKPSLDVVYVVEIDPDVLSTKFEDWIERDLLLLSSWDIEDIAIKNYTIPPIQRKFDFEAEYRDSKWNLVDLTQYSNNQPHARALRLDEELDVEGLIDLKVAVDDLQIAGVRLKPKGLGDDLRVFEEIGSDVNDLARRGYYVTRDTRELLSTNGEVHVGMKDGVEYVLRFGEALAVSNDDETGGMEERKNRYLFVMTRVDMSKLPTPEFEELPGTDETAVEDPNADAESDTVAKEAEIMKERERIMKENERKLKEYDEKVDHAKEKVAELNKRFGGWYYVVSDEQYKKIFLGLDELIKKKENEGVESDGVDAFRNLEIEGLEGRTEDSAS